MMSKKRMLSGRMRHCQIVLVLCCFFSILPEAEARWGRRLFRRAQNDRHPEPSAAVEDVYTRPDHSTGIPGVPFLFQALGKELYAYVNQRKYKFWIFMASGRQLPDETTFVTLLNLTCNLLYGLSTLVGFWSLPRGFMLVATAATVLVGPALVLILLGIVTLVLIAFALYPVASVVTLWIIFFLTSHLVHVLGRRLGLDKDRDGDVDWLDLLRYFASTRTGKFFRLDSLHYMLNKSSMNQFKIIHRRLDEIQRHSSSNRFVAADASTDKTCGLDSHDEEDDGNWIPL